MTTFGQIYRQACSGSPTGFVCDGYNAFEPAWSQLSAATNTLVASGTLMQAVANNFQNKGAAAGVNHAP